MDRSSMMPTVRCSSCGNQIEIMSMGDHVCSSVPASNQAAPKALPVAPSERIIVSPPITASVFSSAPAKIENLDHILPHLDTAAANLTGNRQGPKTAISESISPRSMPRRVFPNPEDFPRPNGKLQPSHLAERLKMATPGRFDIGRRYDSRENYDTGSPMPDYSGLSRTTTAPVPNRILDVQQSVRSPSAPATSRQNRADNGAVANPSAYLADDFGIGNPFDTTDINSPPPLRSPIEADPLPEFEAYRDPSDMTDFDKLLNSLRNNTDRRPNEGPGPPRNVGSSPLHGRPSTAPSRSDKAARSGTGLGNLAPGGDNPIPSPTSRAAPSDAARTGPRSGVSDSARVGPDAGPPTGSRGATNDESRVVPSGGPRADSRATSSANASATAREGSRPGWRSRGDCRACGDVIIHGPSVASADGQLSGRYHKACFVCFKCKMPFASNQFYVYRDQPFCAKHYHQLNGSICDICGLGIEGQYLMDESDGKFHFGCFRCRDCQTSLDDGYFEVGGRFYCERHAWRRTQRFNTTADGGSTDGGDEWSSMIDSSNAPPRRIRDSVQTSASAPARQAPRDMRDGISPANASKAKSKMASQSPHQEVRPLPPPKDRFLDKLFFLPGRNKRQPSAPDLGGFIPATRSAGNGRGYANFAPYPLPGAQSSSIGGAPNKTRIAPRDQIMQRHQMRMVE